MRRSLVLTNEAARHPFRASLPPHGRAQAIAVPERPKQAWFTTQDAKEFLLAYCACFLAVSLYIA